MTHRRFAALGSAVFLGLVAGCHGGGGGPPTLEPKDELIFQGGSPLTYRAAANGQVTVTDLNQDVTVYTGPIGEDQDLELDPPRRQIRVGGKVAADDLRRGDLLRVTFQPSGN